MKYSIVLFVFIFILISACTHKRIVNNVSLKKKKGATYSVVWVKDKGKKFDMKVKVTNDTKKTLLKPLGGMWCTKGKKKGIVTRLSEKGIPTGYMTELAPHAGFMFNFTCDVGNITKGDMNLRIGDDFILAVKDAEVETPPKK